MSLRLLGVAILCMGGSLGTWAQDRDRAPHTRPARLSGRVVAADTGRPIGRAQVSLMRSSDARPSLFAATNDAGIFSFDEVPEGRYIITASKHGLYLEKHYGETAPDVPPKLVTVAPDSVIEIEIILQRASAISGRIFDETGNHSHTRPSRCRIHQRVRNPRHRFIRMLRASRCRPPAASFALPRSPGR